MKLNDHIQNLGMRVAAIQVLAFILLAGLGARLYYLQIVKGDYYSEKAENQRVRLIPIPAPRGVIFDRNGKILVDSRPIYNVVLSNEPIKRINVDDRVDDYARGLNLDPQFVVERLGLIKKQNEFEAMVLKENATMQDIVWVESHTQEYPELRVELQPQRFYPLGTALAHVLGYVGEISPKQLEDPDSKEKGLRPGDIVGKGGLEQYYDEYLRGKPGYRKVIVDSRGRVQNEIEVVQPQPGQDMVTTIDLDLQMTAEQQLAQSATKRGTIISMDPNNGEILAMASAPSFDPNVFVNGRSTPQGRKEIAKYYTDPQRPLLNRAIQGRFHPGSTWKIPESVAALRQGLISVGHSNIVCGGGIQVGNRFTRDTSGNHGTPDLPAAITHSCDGYYYRLALKMGLEGIKKMVETFEYDKTSGIDLPNEKISQTPKSFESYVRKRDGGKWNDIETVFAAIGQVTVNVTPISMIRAVSSVGERGKLYVPHLLKEFKPVSAVGDEGDPSYVPPRPGFAYDAQPPKIIEMTDAQYDYVLKGMWGVVNNGGTAGGIKMTNLEIAGKTGTAQNSEIGSGGAKDHAWFVSFAPAYKPEISVIALIENSGFGAANAAPAVKAVYEEYLLEKNPQPPGGQEVAVSDATKRQ
ncbi:MAG TPA: penicillin-binding protein 2 [Pyrinomonadaceae bacterium]|jgi:penicillin-binding protein 2|nr:penicillin-binding protein 2 [Pyrinomonadaceae bacterium]